MSAATGVDTQGLIASLERFADVLPALVGGIPDADVRWRPDDESWSILEIASHLADEEVADFRPRLEATLRDPNETWAPIDPRAWAVDRRYNDGDLDEVVERFVAARRESIAWLRSLDDPDLAAAHDHPLGVLRAGDLLVSWAAHDALHMRQIAKRIYQLADRDGGTYSPRYAGEW